MSADKNSPSTDLEQLAEAMRACNDCHLNSATSRRSVVHLKTAIEAETVDDWLCGEHARQARSIDTEDTHE